MFKFLNNIFKKESKEIDINSREFHLLEIEVVGKNIYDVISFIKILNNTNLHKEYLKTELIKSYSFNKVYLNDFVKVNNIISDTFLEDLDEIKKEIDFYSNLIKLNKGNNENVYISFNIRFLESYIIKLQHSIEKINKLYK